MRWLTTIPDRRGGEVRYADWLARRSIEAHWIDGSDPIPEALSPYGALLLTGGADVEPALYGAKTSHPRTYGVDPVRDAQELELIRRFLDDGRPVFGICRGLQILNVAMGGELYQHVPDVVPERMEKHRKRKQVDALHGIGFDRTARMGWCLQRIERVNSAHHQAIDPKAVGRHLRIVACSPQGVVEAIEGTLPEVAVAAVQWHPERMPAGSPGSDDVLDYFQSLARED